MAVRLVPSLETFKQLCPIPTTKPAREHYAHKENETPSLEDPVFSDLREQDQITPQQLALLATKPNQIEASKEWTQQHMDARVARFFEQLVVCYKTPFHFEIGETAHQAKSTGTLSKNGTKVQFDSAHSSTIPCLYAYDRTAWERYKSTGGDKPEGFVYLQDSDTYRLHNATIGLVKVINQGDIALDGNKDAQNPKLRMQAIEIINRAAQGEVAPEEGLALFVTKAQEVIDALLDSRGCKQDTKKVLQVYKEQLAGIQEEMQDPAFFDRLLDVRVEEDGLRHGVYPLRYKIIRECHEMQSLISQKIKKVSEEILAGSNSPPNFDIAYKITLLERATPTTKLALEKLFCLSKEGLEKSLTKRPLAARALIGQEANTQKIKTLVNGFWMDFWELKRKELFFRRDLFNHLVSYNSYRQKDVAGRYKELYPAKPMSQSGVSRIKNDIKPITQQLAQEMSTVFNVDAGLFFPALFTSLYN